MENKKNFEHHKVVIDDRKDVLLDGVVDVLAFDEEEIVLETEMGMMVIKGANLHVNKLDLENGIVRLDGEINSLSYTDQDIYGKVNESFLGKLFKG